MCLYKLRPHHGMCLHYFRGEGYSKEFIKNMQDIVNTLESNPVIKLTSDGDHVCGTCPNRVGTNSCLCDDKVLRYDQLVVKHCGLSVNSLITWNEFAHLINTHILDPGIRESICGDCEWNHLCQK